MLYLTANIIINHPHDTVINIFYSLQNILIINIALYYMEIDVGRVSFENAQIGFWCLEGIVKSICTNLDSIVYNRGWKTKCEMFTYAIPKHSEGST